MNNRPLWGLLANLANPFPIPSLFLSLVGSPWHILLWAGSFGCPGSFAMHPPPLYFVPLADVAGIFSPFLPIQPIAGSNPIALKQMGT